MKLALFYELMQFAFSRQTMSEKLKYAFRAVLFYFPMAKMASAAEKNNTSASGSLSGDDIYPLF